MAATRTSPRLRPSLALSCLALVCKKNYCYSFSDGGRAARRPLPPPSPPPSRRPTGADPSRRSRSARRPLRAAPPDHDVDMAPPPSPPMQTQKQGTTGRVLFLADQQALSQTQTTTAADQPPTQGLPMGGCCHPHGGNSYQQCTPRGRALFTQQSILGAFTFLYLRHPTLNPSKNSSQKSYAERGSLPQRKGSNHR